MFRILPTGALNRTAVMCIASAIIGALLVLNVSCQTSAGPGDYAVMFGVLRQANLLASTAAVPTTAAMTPEDLNGLSEATGRHKLALNEQVALLGGENREGTARIRQLADELVTNAEAIDGNRADFRRIMAEGRQKTRAFYGEFDRGLDAELLGTIDDQFHEVVSQYDGSSGPAEEDFLRYHHMFNLMASLRMANIRIRGAANIDLRPDMAAFVEEQYLTNAEPIRHSMNYLAENGGPHLGVDTLPQIDDLLEAESIFDSLQLRLELSARRRN